MLKTLALGVKPLCRWPGTGQRGRSLLEQGEGFPGIASTLVLPPSGPLVMPICHQAGISIKPPKEGSGVMQTGVVKATRLEGFPGAAGAGLSLYTAPIDPGRGPALFPALHSRDGLSIKLTPWLRGTLPPPLPPSPVGLAGAELPIPPWSSHPLNVPRSGAEKPRAAGHSHHGCFFSTCWGLGLVFFIIPGLCPFGLWYPRAVAKPERSEMLSRAAGSFVLSGSPSAFTAVGYRSCGRSHEHPGIVCCSSLLG